MEILKELVKKLDFEYNEENEKEVAKYCFVNFAYLQNVDIIKELEEVGENAEVLDFRPNKRYDKMFKNINNVLYELTYLLSGYDMYSISLTNKKDIYYYSCNELDFYFKEEKINLINELMKQNLYYWGEMVLND